MKFRSMGFVLFVAVATVPALMSRTNAARSKESPSQAMTHASKFPTTQEVSVRQRLRARQEWFARGRQSPDSHPSAWHLLKAYKQAKHLARVARPFSLAYQANATSTASWMELGPRPLNTSGSTLSGVPFQDYGNVSGRVTAIAADLANDPTGNTVYLGAAYGGVWRSTNALSASPAFTPISDETESLSVGSIALGPDVTTGVPTIYVGTGEANNSSDSYYGIGILKSTDGGQTWTLSTEADNGSEKFFGLAFSKILVDPQNAQIVLASTVGAGCCGGQSAPVSQQQFPNEIQGLYRSTDGGGTWSLVVTPGGPYNMGWTDLVYDSASGKYYAAIDGFGIWSSTDQGATWTAVSSPFANGISATALDSNGHPYFLRASLAVGANALWAVISDENGNLSTPTPCPVGGPYSSCDTGIIGSGDGGATWTPVVPPGGTENILFCETVNNAPHCQGYYDQFIGVTPNGNDLVLGGLDVWSTASITGPWVQLTQGYGSLAGEVHSDQHALAFVDSTHWYIGNDGGLWSTADAGGTGSPSDWTNSNATLGNVQFYSIAPDQANAGVYVGGEQDNGSAKTGSNTTWTRILLGDGGITETDPSNPQHYFLEQDGSANGLLLSADAGATANAYQTVVNSTTIPEWSTGLELVFPYEVIAGNTANAILGTCRVWAGPDAPTSPGAGWAPISNDLTQASSPSDCSTEQGNITFLAAAPSSADTIYVVTSNGNIWLTTNGTCSQGSSPTCSMPTWQLVGTTDLLHPLSSVAVSPVNPKTAYVGVQGFDSSTFTGHLFMTTNDGATWTNISGSPSGGGLPDAPVNSILIDPQYPNFIYVASDVGVFVATDGGAGGANEQWAQLGPGLPDAAVLQIAFSSVGSRMVVAATHGRGAWQVPALPDPDFSLALNPNSQSVLAGTNTTITISTSAINGDTVNISLSCSAPNNGCTVSPTSVAPGGSATATFPSASLNDGVNHVTISATDGINNHSIAGSVDVEDFSLSSSSNSASVTPGASASYTISVVPQGGVGFTNPISLACAGLPSLTSCTFSPASVTPGSSTTTSTLTITTTAPSSVLPFFAPSGPIAPHLLVWLTLLLTLAVVVIFARQSRRQIGFGIAACALLLCLVVPIVSCGGGAGGNSAPRNPGTPTGTYSVTVTGTSGQLQHSTTVALTVQ